MRGGTRWLFSLIAGLILMPAVANDEGLLRFGFSVPQAQVQLAAGARLTAEKEAGSYLQLPQQGQASLILTPSVSAREGSIVFWLRPRWAASNTQSHVFLSGTWRDGQDGYLALSYGWWEPSGSGRLYFIVNNQQRMHCSAPYRFESNTWVLVSAVWISGAQGQCALYVDDQRIAVHQSAFAGDYVGAATWFIGSDAGASDRRQRAADFDIDELQFHTQALSEREIHARFRHPSALAYTKGRSDWAWMQEVLAQPEKPTRFVDGVLRESRIMFDEDMHWAYSREAADRILQRLKAAGFNVYVPCVWHGRGTHYPTNITEADSRLLPVLAHGYDPLAYLIERAHELGIEVHPWFTVMRREWSLYPEFYPAGTPDNAYDVHNSGFREFMVNLILDVVRRYPVDGINLDYIRAMGICTSAYCERDYEQHTGGRLTRDYYLRGVADSSRRRIEQWQDAAVAGLVERISAGARALKPEIVISVDGHPKPKQEQRPLEGRDEIAWANHGWVDVIYAMDYRRRFDADALDDVRHELHEPRRLIPLFGNYDRVDGEAVSRPGVLMEKYIEFTRRKWPGSGMAFYIYAMMNDEQRDLLQHSVFRQSALTYWPPAARDDTRRLDTGPTGLPSAAVR